MLLDALFGERALDLLGRGFGVSECDLVLVDAGSGFLKEVAAGATENGRLPVEAAVLAGNEEDGGVGLAAGTGEIEDGGEAECH